MGVTIKKSARIKKMMVVTIEEIASDALDEIAKKSVDIAKVEAPKSDYGSDPGALREAHSVKHLSKNSKALVNSKDYAHWVVRDHRVLTSQKALRWFFGVFLKEHPDFKRKTSGGPRQVPADKYPEKVKEILIAAGYTKKAVDKSLKKNWGIK